MIYYIDRQTGKQEEEQVYGKKALELLYGYSTLSKVFGWPLVQMSAKLPFISAFYGWLQKRPESAQKIGPFIQQFHVDPNEFAIPIEHFGSFNDFFIRKLKPESRPIHTNPFVIPADGRYWFYPSIEKAQGFVVKGEKFHLVDLLQDADLASKYTQGSMAIARLCPTDYHRFHFPVQCLPGDTKTINGWLYSVNPIAVKKDIQIFSKNKRTLCALKTDHFGTVLFLEIGATNVGSIHETYTPHQPQQKGAEKGYFSFGASALILLFEPGKIKFDQDLVDATDHHLEIKCLMGQSMGHGA
jgi:phosphatidylserine decarboxylase